MMRPRPRSRCSSCATAAPAARACSAVTATKVRCQARARQHCRSVSTGALATGRQRIRCPRWHATRHPNARRERWRRISRVYLGRVWRVGPSKTSRGVKRGPKCLRLGGSPRSKYLPRSGPRNRTAPHLSHPRADRPVLLSSDGVLLSLLSCPSVSTGRVTTKSM